MKIYEVSWERKSSMPNMGFGGVSNTVLGKEIFATLESALKFKENMDKYGQYFEKDKLIVNVPVEKEIS